MKPKLTKTLVYAVALDAAERSRRARGLAAWDEEARLVMPTTQSLSG
jgi:hypothetical protein